MSYKIVYNKAKCIGAGACEALSEKYWKVSVDRKAELLGGKRELHAGGNSSGEEGEIFTKEIDDGELQIAKEFCWGCPSKAIELFDSEGKKAE